MVAATKKLDADIGIDRSAFRENTLGLRRRPLTVY
jgi:hypothetical protein